MRCAILICIAFALAGCRPAAGPVSTHTGAHGDKYWQEARFEVYRSVPELRTQHRTELAKGIVLRKLMEGDPGKKQIAITFDDGPHPQYTPKLLEILKKYDAKATFFVIGWEAEKYPDLIRAEIAGGHSVGNHTYHHVNLTKVPLGRVATEIQACGDVVQAITHKRPTLFRPPGGDYNTRVGLIANQLGYSIVLWTDDPADYASPGDKVVLDRTLKWVHNGGIILIHDGAPETLDILPEMLHILKSRGYQFVTVDEMMKQS